MVCLHSISAKETCNALLRIFSRIGIPRCIVSDNGTNFTSKMFVEMNEMLGVELRTSSPFHPEGNLLVERFQQTLKKMLRIVISSEKPREWEKKIEYLLWSYRSLPHSTLGCSPYQMVYGRLPRGPLSVLRDQMSGMANNPPLSTVTVKDFCEKVIKDIQVGHDLSVTESEKAQQSYVSNYNLRSRDKHFAVGDEVIVLFPDSNNKLLAKFQGPCLIKEKLNDYAYLVEMPDNSVRRLHANKLRKYVCRNVQSVIHDDESDFGISRAIHLYLSSQTSLKILISHTSTVISAKSCCGFCASMRRSSATNQGNVE